MIQLQAPYPLIQTITCLPNPELSDSEAILDEIIKKRSMDGTLHTYIKTKNNRRKLLMQFKLDRLKGLELRAFIRAYYLTKIRIIDHLDQVWVGNFTVNPFEFDTGSSERQDIILEFEGIKQ